jgi:hypothetical protein
MAARDVLMIVHLKNAILNIILIPAIIMSAQLALGYGMSVRKN